MLLIGRDAICRYLNCSWRTVRKKRKLYSFPIRIYPPDIPCLDTDELRAYLASYSRRMKEKAELSTPCSTPCSIQIKNKFRLPDKNNI